MIENLEACRHEQIVLRAEVLGALIQRTRDLGFG